MKDSQTLFETLKAQTSKQHRAIESAIPIMKPSFTVDDYKKYISLFLDFMHGVELHLKTHLPPKLFKQWQDRLCKTALLEEDAFNLEIPVKRTNKDWEKQNLSFLSDLTTVPDLIGIMYVLEGSTLGGQLITRSLKERLKLRSDTMNYLNCYGTETSFAWKQFAKECQDVITTEGYRQSIRAAATTFNNLNSLMIQAFKPHRQNSSSNNMNLMSKK